MAADRFHHSPPGLCELVNLSAGYPSRPSRGMYALGCFMSPRSHAQKTNQQLSPSCRGRHRRSERDASRNAARARRQPEGFRQAGMMLGPTGHSAPNGTVVAAARVGHAGSSVAALTWTEQPRPGLAARDAREGPKAQVINIYARRQLFAAAENTIYLPGRQGQRRVPLPTVRGMGHKDGHLW